ncbi:MAG: helix-turn-helix domain-containing protein [Bacteroidota bacterium]
MQFSLIDVITLIGIIQGFLLSFVLFRLNEGNRSANSVLAGILVIASSVLLGRMIIAHDFAMHIFKWISFTDGIIFLFGPLTYLYVRRLIEARKQPFKLSFYHYVPAVLYALIFIFLRSRTEDQTIVLYQKGYIYWIFNSFEWVGLVSNFYYLYRSSLILRAYKKQEKNLLSYRQDFFQFLSIYLASVTVCIALWLFSYINAYYLQRFFVHINYNTIWFAIPLFIYLVGYFSLKQPELFRVKLSVDKVASTNRLNSFEVQRLKKRLVTIMEDNKLFLQADLTLSDVAGKIESSPNDLSWLLNNIYHLNFYDFVNQYRIEEFTAAVKRGEHHNLTILSMALDAGFKSKSTFNKAFKLYMKTTPREYIKNLANQIQAA